jgi:hypothetical protein
MTQVLDYILGKFPQYRSKIIYLFNKNEDFRIVCEDYIISLNALEDCRQKVIRDSEIENEYSQLFIELEKELVRLFEAKVP